MHYELYIDSLIWINFWMNLYLLILTNISTLRTATPQRICVGAVMGATGFIIPFLSLPFPLLGMMVGIVTGTVGMLLLTFRVRSWKTFFHLLEQMLFFSFCVGGSLLFLGNALPKMQEILQKPMGLISVSGVISFLIGRVKAVGGRGNCVCRATLKNGCKNMSIPALIDSGNSLVEPISGKPVCVIDKSVYESLWDGSNFGFRAIPYHSVGKKRGILPGFLLEELEIDYEGMQLQFQNVYVAVGDETVSNGSGGESIKIIVNPMLFRERGRGKPGKRQNERRNDFKSGNAGKNAI